MDSTFPFNLSTRPAPSLARVPNAAWGKVLWAAGFAALYFLCAFASMRTFWLPCGFALAAFLLVERRHWVWLSAGLLLGEAAYNLMGAASWPWWASWSLSLTNLGSAIGGALLCQWISPGKPGLDSVPRFLVVLCFGGMIALAPTAAIGANFARLMGSKRDFFTVCTGWYLRDCLGIILVTPLVLSWSTTVGREEPTWHSRRQSEAWLLMATLAAVLVSTLFLSEANSQIVRIEAIPVLLWASMRFGVRGISAVSFILALGVGWLAMKGYGLGPLDARTVAARNLELQITLASMAFIGLIPAIIVQAQRRAELRLREERNLFQATLDHEPDGVLLIGLTGRLLQVNRAGRQLLDLPERTGAEPVDPVRLLLPEFREAFTAAFRRSADGASQQLEFLLPARNGGRRLIAAKLVPVRSADGITYAVLNAWRDITEERRLLADLTVARFTVDRATVPMMWVGKDRRVVDTNDALCHLLGYTRAEIVERSVGDFDTEHSPARWPEFWREVTVERTADFETTLRHRGGELITVEIRTHYIDLDLGTERRELLCAFIQDVTAQRQAAEIVRRSEERLSLIFGAVAEGIMVYDGGGRLIDANPAARRLFDFTPENFGQTAPLLPARSWMLEDGRPAEAKDDPVMLTVSTARAVRGAVRGFTRPDGEATWLSVSTEPLLNSRGDVTLVVSSYSDLTSLRSLQEQLRHAQKMEVFGQLAGGIAHDFNNILTSIGINLHLLERSPGSPPTGDRYMGNLYSLTKRAAGLTEQLLLFAQRRVVQMQPIELNTSLKGLLKILGPALGEKVKLSYRLSRTEVWISGDPGMIDQVGMNLCLNARDAMPAGGRITIETGIETVPAEIASASRFPHARPGEFAYFRVSDTGTGIPPAVLARIFEPFFTTKDTGKGTGLGLATVHGILDQHHGWTSVRSVEGEGTAFTVYLPFAPSRDAGSAPQQPAPDQLRGHETILFVEDETSMRVPCAALLRDNGYRVLEADDPAEAINRWQDHVPSVDLLITDMVMPGKLSGLDLVTRLRQTRPELRVVVISGYNEEIIKSEQLQEHRVVLLPKPFDFGALGQTIRTVLDSK